MKLIYTFTKRLNESNLDSYVKLWKDSYHNNKQYHNIKLFTDYETVDLFSDTFDDIEIIHKDSVTFLDDFKVEALSRIEDNDILIDGDVYLSEKLNIPNAEICCDRIFKCEGKFYNYYKEITQALIHEGAQTVVEDYKFQKQIPNIGLLSFRNSKQKYRFINQYGKLKWFYNNRKFPFIKKYGLKKTSAAVTQTLLGSYNVEEFYLKNNYEHLSGDRPSKFRKKNTKEIL